MNYLLRGYGGSMAKGKEWNRGKLGLTGPTPLALLSLAQGSVAPSIDIFASSRSIEIP